MAVPVRELEGEVAIVTGGAKNIGRATCLELAAAGAAVCINALNSVEEAQGVAAEIEAAGGKSMVHAGDVSDPAVVEAMVAATAARFGSLTILVNNASLRRMVPLAEMSLEEFRTIMRVNVEAVFLCAKAALPHMIDAKGGSIITLGGLTAHAGVKSRLHVSTSKAAVVGMTMALAHEGAEAGVTANVVVPGMIDTVRTAATGVLPPGYTGEDNLLNRKGRPEEIAAMIRALCGPAGRYTTGQTIHVNGGAYTTT
ncbi:MAG: SDR family oxidoreductase [Alphaproteobacteria bacterium]|nr:SDR family oxidoreductase [Alphaproteobacteria bacterium]